MCGRLLEATCSLNNVTGRTLHQSLAKMKEIGLIDGRLWEWADTLRTIRNAAAHYDGATVIGKQDAADALAFNEALLDYLYVLNARFNELKARNSTSKPHRVVSRKAQPAPRQAPPDTAEVAGSAGVPVQVGASFVRKPRPGGCHGVPVQAVGAGHGQRRAGRARRARSGVPGPALPAWLPGPAAGRRAGDPVPDSPRVQDLLGGVPAADRGWVPPPGGVVRGG